MTVNEQKRILFLREQGCKYSQISEDTGIPIGTIKTFFRRNQASAASQESVGVISHKKDEAICKCCGCRMVQKNGQKPRKFCSNSCRMKWWNSHPELMKKKRIYEYICPECKKVFTSVRKGKKYCCHECYIRFRYGGGNDGA